MSIPLKSISGMPAFSSYYPMPPARYRNVCFQTVYFRADVTAVARVLPDCLEPSDDGFCAAIGLSVPWSANYGAFQESLILVRCRFEDQVGYFAPVVFLDSRSSISAGREIYGTPKVFAEMTVSMEERVMYTDTRLAGTAALSIRSTMHRTATLEDFPNLSPSWRLKVIPRADGPQADICQLIDGSEATSEITIHVCQSGDGVVEFHPTPTFNLADFTPREYFGAQYLEMDYTEGYARIVRDFLREPAS